MLSHAAKFMQSDAAPLNLDSLRLGASRANEALRAQQKQDGHFVFELEADATIPAEYVLLMHWLDEVDALLQAKIAAHLRAIQQPAGGWPLFHDGAPDISATVKAYFALKAAGDDVQAPHMQRARAIVHQLGGAERTNVFTRFQLALFAAAPWRAVPVMPVEIMLLPRWFPFHLDKISYWSRTVIVPMLGLMALKPVAKNPLKIHVDELFLAPPALVKDWHSNKSRSWLNPAFRLLDGLLRHTEPFWPKFLRRKALQAAQDWMRLRLNGEDGLGAIYPAMANAVMFMEALGVAKDAPELVVAKRALRLLVVDKEHSAYVQPCVSPVWDTALVAQALLETAQPEDITAARRALDWLAARQILDLHGDWAVQNKSLRPGGWAFQYHNAYYPDLDDTAVVVMAMHRCDAERYANAIHRGVEWVLGLQSRNGGFAAFDANNTHEYLNHIPFADHGALLDPPTDDVTARCLSMLAQLGYGPLHPAVERAVAFLRRTQLPDGSWFGRWGTNYLYGTWSVLCALNAAGLPKDDPMLSRAAAWLQAKQREDGGWGEDGVSYWDDQPRGEGKVSTPSQTAWAMLGLMAAGVAPDAAHLQRGAAYLLSTQNENGLWEEAYYTAVGFPKVFYLKYHGYAQFFPAWALSRLTRLQESNEREILSGM